MVKNQEITIIVPTIAIIIVTIIVESEEACYVRTSTEKVVTGSWDEGGWRLDRVYILQMSICQRCQYCHRNHNHCHICYCYCHHCHDWLVGEGEGGVCCSLGRFSNCQKQVGWATRQAGEYTVHANERLRSTSTLSQFTKRPVFTRSSILWHELNFFPLEDGEGSALSLLLRSFLKKMKLVLGMGGCCSTQPIVQLCKAHKI